MTETPDRPESHTSEAAPYPDVSPQPDFPALETAMLEFWREDGTFEASIAKRAAEGAPDWVFYDGPPFANGLPHYGSLFTGYIKDAVPRYQNMRGRRVERRFGWDCHGLPAEIETEKELGVSGRQAIIDFGIKNYNDACRTSVLRYTSEWERYVTRQARWVDFENDYKTLDLPYMESVMWAFKTLYDKGLAYEGYRVLAYCWECETPLSNTETRMDDAYLERQDPALTVGFELDDGRLLLAWTTTPWTLPSNLALAVGAGVEYVESSWNGRTVVTAAAAAERYGFEPNGPSFPGSRLVGLRYKPLFGYFAGAAAATNQPNAFQVLPGDFVNTEEGTGAVHLAPGFGEDDQRLCEANGIAVVCPVDSRGRFTSEVTDFAGMQVFEANTPITRRLRESGAVVREDSHVHSYPHCWRSGTPLIYRAVTSWFVRVTAFKDRMVELNQEINWVPAHIKDGQFGKWLENARDWSISRNRFWGAPIPVWNSDDPSYPRIDVYGSLDDIERDFGIRPNDLHRPMVDDLVRPNPDDPTGRSTMRRIEDVLDCWFESGSMPFAQVHYPFENRDWFQSHYPGDFIVEYTPQTRGWFYTLHVLATALFDRPSFRSCLAHGTLLGNDGQKMSKSLANYPEVFDAFDRYGSDAVRWSLLSSPIVRGGEALASERAIAEAVRRVLLPVWNSWYFFALYANADRYKAQWRTDAPGTLDRYVLASLREVVVSVTAGMDSYDLYAASTSLLGFIDTLTNWYIRRSRDRFWTSDRDAFDTLYTVLELLARLLAPFAPLVAEAIWKDLTGRRSVHLEDWPEAGSLPSDPDLVKGMALARDVCSAASAVRKAHGLRVRLPLRELTVVSADANTVAPVVELIRDEVNVKLVTMADDLGAAGRFDLSLVPAVLGPRLGPTTQKLIAAAKAGEWAQRDGTVVVAGEQLQDGEYTLRLVPTDPSRSAVLGDGAGLIVLDTEVTPALEEEGCARDVVRLVQNARRDAGLHVSDRIHLVLDLPDDVAAAVREHQDFVAGETLASELVLAGPISYGHRAELTDGRAVHIGLHKVG